MTVKISENNEDDFYTWRVFLRDDNHVDVIAHRVEYNAANDCIYFEMGWPRDVSVTIAMFIRSNICGYVLIKGMIRFGVPVK